MNDSTGAFSAAVANVAAPAKVFYRMPEVAQILGVPQSTLDKEVQAGRLKYHLPAGRKQGRMFRAEWVDEWIERGTHE